MENKQNMKIYVLTKYERARVLGTRAIQLEQGAIPMVPTDGLHSVMDIAEKELRENKLPVIIRRKMPDGTFLDIKVSDMIVD